ncbi:MAG: PIN domain-containing protein, partial [bacterium]|nr:PIN domain-containing protein [bacterium]
MSKQKIMNFDSLAAESYGKIRADLEKAGTPIEPLDMMITGHAKALGYTVVTNNTKEFERVKGLKLE